MTESSTAFPQDPAYTQAVIDLLGAIAYGELTAFERLAEDGKLAPTLEDKVAIGSMAAVQFGHIEQEPDWVVDRIDRALQQQIATSSDDGMDEPLVGQHQATGLFDDPRPSTHHRQRRGHVCQPRRGE